MKIDWSQYIYFTFHTGWVVRKMTYERSHINGMRMNLPWNIGTEITWRKNKTIYTGKVTGISYDCLMGELTVTSWNNYNSEKQALEVLELLDI